MINNRCNGLWLVLNLVFIIPNDTIIASINHKWFIVFISDHFLFLAESQVQFKIGQLVFLTEVFQALAKIKCDSVLLSRERNIEYEFEVWRQTCRNLLLGINTVNLGVVLEILNINLD